MVLTVDDHGVTVVSIRTVKICENSRIIGYFNFEKVKTAIRFFSLPEVSPGSAGPCTLPY